MRQLHLGITAPLSAGGAKRLQVTVEVDERDDVNADVKVEAGDTRRVVRVEDVTEAAAAAAAGAADAAALEHLTAASLLHTLRTRATRDLYYTSVRV
jgi:hypothetical protein